jgi:hypothetical protein
VRDMNNPALPTYSDYTTYRDNHGNTVEPHMGGEFYSSCLWHLGGPRKDLIIKSLLGLPSSTTFLQGRQAIINYDRTQYGGVHNQMIQNTFYVRGLGFDSLGNPGISGPLQLGFKQIGTYTANVSNGSGSFAYQWWVKYNHMDPWYALVNTTQSIQRTMSYDDFTLRCQITDNLTAVAKSGYIDVQYGLGKNGTPHPSNQQDKALPQTYSLSENYPNPFNPSTDIKYGLSLGGHVSLTVFDVLGREVKSLVNGSQEAGYYSIRWDGSNNAGLEVVSGIYFARLAVTDSRGLIVFSQSNKMLLIR